MSGPWALAAPGASGRCGSQGGGVGTPQKEPSFPTTMVPSKPSLTGLFCLLWDVGRQGNGGSWVERSQLPCCMSGDIHFSGVMNGCGRRKPFPTVVLERWASAFILYPRAPEATLRRWGKIRAGRQRTSRHGRVSVIAFEFFLLTISPH